MSAKVQEWFDKFSKWPERKRLVSSFSIKLMLLEERDLMTDQEETIKSKELCLKSLIKWMVLNQEVTSKF